jgi:hypothetical protein
MYNTSNEIIIESAEITLLVTEGLVDKSKKAFATVIKKIKEFIRKVVTYIKSKLTNKIKTVDKNIKKVKVDETETETLEEPITLANSKKLDELLDSVETVLKTAKEVLLSVAQRVSMLSDSQLDEFHDTITNKYETLESLYEKYKDDIDETYTEIPSSIYDVYGKTNRKCSDLTNDIMECAWRLDDAIKGISDSTDNSTAKRMQIITKTQATITKAITVADFVTNSCNRSITNLYR